MTLVEAVAQCADLISYGWEMGDSDDDLAEMVCAELGLCARPLGDVVVAAYRTNCVKRGLIT
jgi:hypothetical protein